MTCTRCPANTKPRARHALLSVRHICAHLHTCAGLNHRSRATIPSPSRRRTLALSLSFSLSTLVPACVPFLSRCVKSVCLPARARSLARRSVCWCAGRCVGSRWLTVRACVSGEPLPDGAMARFLSLFASPRSSHSSVSRVVLSRFSLSLFPSVFLLRLRRLRLLLVASLAHLLSLSHFLLNSFLPCALAIDRIENSKELMCAIGKIENLRYKVTIDAEEPPIKGRNLNRARPRVFLRLSLTESLLLYTEKILL